MTYTSENYKLLEPFLNLANSFSDINDKRSSKREQWIFTTHPLDWKQEFPKLVVECENISPKLMGGGIEDQDYYTTSIEYDVVFTYYVKRMKEYICPDNIKRKGKGLIEYMIINNFLPRYNKNRIQILRENCWIDIITHKGIGKIEPALEEYAFKCDFSFNVVARLKTDVPFSGDMIIEQIKINNEV